MQVLAPSRAPFLAPELSRDLLSLLASQGVEGALPQSTLGGSVWEVEGKGNSYRLASCTVQEIGPDGPES